MTRDQLQSRDGNAQTIPQNSAPVYSAPSQGAPTGRPRGRRRCQLRRGPGLAALPHGVWALAARPGPTTKGGTGTSHWAPTLDVGTTLPWCAELNASTPPGLGGSKENPGPPFGRTQYKEQVTCKRRQDASSAGPDNLRWLKALATSGSNHSRCHDRQVAHCYA